MSRKPKPTFPALATGGSAALVCVEVEVIPLLAGVVRKFEQRAAWDSDDDHARAYQWAAAFQEQLMGASCLQELIESNRQIYRLLDSALNGTAYSLNGDLVEPAIPAAPVNAIGDAPGLRRQLLDMQGTLPDGWFGLGSRPATLSDIARALNNGSATKRKSLFDQIKDVLNAGASAATIFNLIEDLLADEASLAEGGVMIATMLASTMAQAALMGAQAAQLDRLIASLDGGALARPEGNVLAELGTILSAVQAIQTNPAAVAQIAATLGTTADCISGQTIVGLLCRLNNAIETIEPLSPPLFTCPGYETKPWITTTSWQRWMPNGNDTSLYFASLSTVPDGMHVVVRSMELVPGDSTTVIPVFQPTLNLLNICVAIDGYATDGFIEISVYEPTTGQMFSTIPIKNAVDAGHYGGSFIASTQYVYAVTALQQYTNMDTLPTSRVWIISGEVVG